MAIPRTGRLSKRCLHSQSRLAEVSWTTRALVRLNGHCGCVVHQQHQSNCTSAAYALASTPIGLQTAVVSGAAMQVQRKIIDGLQHCIIIKLTLSCKYATLRRQQLCPHLQVLHARTVQTELSVT